MKRRNGMFDSIVRAQLTDLRDTRAEARQAAEAEAHLDAPVTRRELLAAIDEVRNEFAGSGFPEQDAIRDAFTRLAAELS